jgi:hypothetical protein
VEVPYGDKAGRGWELPVCTKVEDDPVMWVPHVSGGSKEKR